MAHQFSDWWNTTQPATTISVPAVKVPVANNHRYYKRAYAILTLTDFAAVTPDVCRMMRLKHTDRLSALFVSSSGASTGTVVEVGLHLPGANADGAVIDADEFASAVDLNGGNNRVEILVEAGATVITRRGAVLWEIAGYATAAAAVAAGASEMDITLTCTTAVATANEPVVLEAVGYFG